jgi:hypothetical protein
MSATLRLIRGAFGCEVRRAPLEITLDGRSAGAVQLDETLEIPLATGRHTLRLRAGRYSSPERSFDVADGEVVSFRCHPAMVWPRLLASMARPGLGISLKRQQ